MLAGRQVVKKEIFLSDPVLTEDEATALSEVIRSGWITMGDRVSELEQEFAAAHESEHAIALASCTAALHLLMIAVGVSRGDEVLVPSLTFVATANAVLYTGGVPVFVDIHGLDRPFMDIDDAERKVTPRTKAIVLVHYGGWIDNMEQWRRFADKHNLSLLEDAAHVPGHRRAARSGDAAAFSFYGNKNMTTAEGGMVLTGDSRIAASVRRLRSHGMTSLTLDRRAGHAYSYDVTHLGYNYRMDELRAALGLVQLGKLREWNDKRLAILERYRELLGNSDQGIASLFPGDMDTIAHLCPVLLEKNSDRPRIMRRLRDLGIHSSIHYPPIHKFSYYLQRLGAHELPITEEFSERELSLPIHPRMTVNDVDYVVEELAGAL